MLLSQNLTTDRPNFVLFISLWFIADVGRSTRSSKNKSFCIVWSFRWISMSEKRPYIGRIHTHKHTQNVCRRTQTREIEKKKRKAIAFERIQCIHVSPTTTTTTIWMTTRQPMMKWRCEFYSNSHKSLRQTSSNCFSMKSNLKGINWSFLFVSSVWSACHTANDRLRSTCFVFISFDSPWTEFEWMRKSNHVTNDCVRCLQFTQHEMINNRFVILFHRIKTIDGDQWLRVFCTFYIDTSNGEIRS